MALSCLSVSRCLPLCHCHSLSLSRLSRLRFLFAHSSRQFVRSIERQKCIYANWNILRCDQSMPESAISSFFLFLFCTTKQRNRNANFDKFMQLRSQTLLVFVGDMAGAVVVAVAAVVAWKVKFLWLLILFSLLPATLFWPQHINSHIERTLGLLPRTPFPTLFMPLMTLLALSYLYCE